MTRLCGADAAVALHARCPGVYLVRTQGRVRQVGCLCLCHEPGSGLAGRVVAFRRRGLAAVPPRVRRAEAGALTARQTQILHVVALGFSDGQIARAGGIAVTSVRTHKRRIFKLLGARNSAHAVGIGLRRGLLRLPDLFPGR